MKGFHTLRRSLLDAGHSANVGDEGGFAPDLRTAEEALDFVVRAIEQTGYKPGTDITQLGRPEPRDDSTTNWESPLDRSVRQRRRGRLRDRM